MKRRSQRIEWTVFDAAIQGLRCLRCEQEYVLALPMAVTEVCKKIEAFNVLHKDCKEKPHALQGPDPGRPSP